MLSRQWGVVCETLEDCVIDNNESGKVGYSDCEQEKLTVEATAH